MRSLRWIAGFPVQNHVQVTLARPVSCKSGPSGRLPEIVDRRFAVACKRGSDRPLDSRPCRQAAEQKRGEQRDCERYPQNRRLKPHHDLVRARWYDKAAERDVGANNLDGIAVNPGAPTRIETFR